MLLPDLIRAAYPGHPALGSLPPTHVRGVAQELSKVVPGGVFVARMGTRVDGHRFALQAERAGAACVVGTRDASGGVAGLSIPYLHVPDDREAVARLASAFFGRPAERVRVLGVTGTDGKTTTAALTWWLLNGADGAALLSTALVRVGDEPGETEGHFTTPEAGEVQAFLARAVAAGLPHAVLEASSHGLAQRRLDEIAFARAVWTNLSPEHLDFHGSLEAYREAKLALIRRAPAAVLNRDDAAYPTFAAEAASHVSYGVHGEADWRLLEHEPEPGHLRLRIGAPDGRAYAGRLRAVGTFNAWNAVAALATAAAEGVDPNAAMERLRTFPGVPGRMEVVQARPFAVIVDFAHTAPALEKALGAVLPATGGAKIVVIGAAGERDPGKRGPLARAATFGADRAIFTEEDARSEDVQAILASMAAAAEEAGGVEGRDFDRVPDRREAIRAAVRRARPGDVVLLAGKGHERTLERSTETLPWDEAAEARAALGEGASGVARSPSRA